MSERFSLGTLLTIRRGTLLTEMGEVYRVVAHGPATPPLTHQPGRAADEIKPWVLQQHPWLADEALVLPDDIEGEGPVLAWLGGKATVYGDAFPVEPARRPVSGDVSRGAPIPEAMYRPRAPIIELRLMVGPDKPIIEVEP